jgi:N-glycosylase/DNA lyase
MKTGVLPLPNPFSLGLTLLCGQCFRWEGPDPSGWFQGVAGRAFWRLRQDEGTLYWECSLEQVRDRQPGEWLVHYLNLGEDLQDWIRAYQNHPVLEQPLKVLRGLRLMRQEPWECSISYMFAQGLSVKVIQQALKKFCAEYGDPVGGFPGYYAFPEPGRLKDLTPEFLRPFTNNYRARADRIIRMARVVDAQVISLDHLKNIPCDDAREALVALDGIGPKIADCILLFSMDQETAFPVDRWVLRAMKRHFRTVRALGAGPEAPTPVQYRKIVGKARTYFGSRCGLASEYLFLYLRALEDGKLRESLAPHGQPLGNFWDPDPAVKNVGKAALRKLTTPKKRNAHSALRKSSKQI